MFQYDLTHVKNIFRSLGLCKTLLLYKKPSRLFTTCIILVAMNTHLYIIDKRDYFHKIKEPLIGLNNERHSAGSSPQTITYELIIQTDCITLCCQAHSRARACMGGRGSRTKFSTVQSSDAASRCLRMFPSARCTHVLPLALFVDKINALDTKYAQSKRFSVSITEM